VTTRIVLDPRAIDPDGIVVGAETLRRGGIVAYPTDTLYGLAVDPKSDAALRRLFEAKGRHASTAIALIASDLEQARQAGRFGRPEEKLAAAFWPGPLTIVVPIAPDMPRRLSGDRGTIGVRVPDHPVARALAAAFGGSITATSANPSGRAAPTTADDVASHMGAVVDVILDAGPVTGGPPSTIVEIIDGTPTLHRAGAVEWDRVLRCLQ
jgi:L-threonylcarbamoyladenylate synthase